jgi:uncharacterized membrane protein YdjX (TVP38/TMEM64 family)
MPSSADGRARAVRVAAVAAIVAGVLIIAWKAGLFALEDREALMAAIERARTVRFLPALFVATYAIAAAVGVPATPLTLAGGALFGVELGIVFNWLGEALAAHLAFGLVRATGITVGGRRASASVSASVSPNALSAGNGFGTLLRLRLIPVVPFALLNAGAAASSMSWRNFAAATLLGIIPITVIYTVSASQLVAGVAGSGTRALVTALASAAVLIAVSFLPALFRWRRK